VSRAAELQHRLIDLNVSLVPGPPFGDAVINSQDLGEIARYPADRVSASIRGWPGMRELSRSSDPWKWKWRWEESGRAIRVDFTLFDDGQRSWGGSDLSGQCRVSDVMSFWRHLLQDLPHIWLHDANCWMYTPDLFVSAFDSGAKGRSKGSAVQEMLLEDQC